MKTKTLAAIIACAFASAPTFAGTKACNGTLVTQGVCPTTGYSVLFYAVSTADPDGAGPRPTDVQLVLDAFAATYGYSATTTCTQQMVNQGTCSSGQLGTVVAESKAQFADRKLREHILGVVARYQAATAIAAAEAAAAAETPPVVGN